MLPVGSRGSGVECGIHASTPRAERRLALAVVVQLSTVEASPSVEKTFTENVSSHGSRVVTKKRLKSEESVLLESLERDLQSQARVVYCKLLRRNNFVVGLDVLSPTAEW